MPGTREIGTSADGKRVYRHYMEFVVDGGRLGRLLGPHLGRDDWIDGGNVPVLVTDDRLDVDQLDRLLGAPALPDLYGRAVFYACALCGDLGCGAVTAVVEVQGDKVVWRDFGYQNDYEPFEQDDIFGGVGPFTFDRDAYSAVLNHFRSLISPSSDGGS